MCVLVRTRAPVFVYALTRSPLISAMTRAHAMEEFERTAICMRVRVCMRACVRACMCMCASARALNFLRRAAHDVEATLARYGGHDSMTSTGRVLFSKGDSAVAAPRGEIAKRRKQPEHVVVVPAIVRRNNEASGLRAMRTSERASERVEYVERTRSVASARVDGKYFFIKTRKSPRERVTRSFT